MPDVKELEDALYNLEDSITVSQAVKATGITRMTIITWCKKYEVGIKVGGRWYINPDKLALLLRGKLKEKK
jgi:hypothetical protein